MFCYTVNSLLSVFAQPQQKAPPESSITPFYFNSELKKWLPLHRDQIGVPPPSKHANFDDVAFGTFKLVCYNVSNVNKSSSDACVRSLLQLLLQEDADVICLQEATLEFVEQIKKELWIQQSYMLSDVEPQNLHGVLMLSRLPLHPFYETYLPSKQQRKMLYADVYINEQSVVRIATSHLDDSAQNVHMRKRQLVTIKSVLLPESEKDNFMTSILCGDFNFTEPNEDEILKSAHFIDAWTHLYPKVETVAGYTSGINYPTSNRSRNDRVYICNHTNGAQWEPVRVKLIGDKPLADEPHVFPSSHLGLSFTFAATWPS
ncbi:hypothetical protein K493DRAFT_377380 [Basidiobolus meristosporus CBS 931.73]|uniref:Endonuclease/exonuclease/phosphatase domain-containing protein n=1 Tax=Basidiobolus meristosporus CBS 931.73 TaxID=1314790 RepID=A0A1Y1Z4H0_9FUNG|nr:hypothetical protein K493DRAFT_377380 [Basidiobolus meristosporus CBS 931.73]|eukprot:ORY05014.1 hypothetical protein K493DRAFT_377380 [Basidiobolus meristosporus CBS 931.73]